MIARLVACACLATGFAHAGEFSFDTSEFEKQPLELSGSVELKSDRAWLRRDSSVYRLNGLNRDTLARNTGTLKLHARYTAGSTSVNLKGSAEARRDELGSERIARFDEAYVSFKPDPGFTVDVGKQVLKWGKGYAWNPVGFVERQKDPNDVDLAREGYTMLTADLIRNFSGDLKTVAFTPVLLPVGNQTNSDFGKPQHANLAAKLYLLYRDTDIDLTWAAAGSRGARYGIDFSRNFGSALEFHGEWARTRAVDRATIDATGAISRSSADTTSLLLGLRYLTPGDTTLIAEWYRNGNGYARDELSDFLRLAASGNPALLARARLVAPAYTRPSAGREYFYLRASQKEPFDIVYLTPAITLMINRADRSWSLTPELAYNGFTNVDLRLRATWLGGGALTEFGEKPNARKIELSARLYF